MPALYEQHGKHEGKRVSLRSSPDLTYSGTAQDSESCIMKDVDITSVCIIYIGLIPSQDRICSNAKNVRIVCEPSCSAVQ
jgi:hypothetical protein